MASEGNIRRHYQGKMALLVQTLAVILPLYAIFYVFDPTWRFDFVFYRGQYVALFLCLFLTLLFLLVPAGKKSPRDRLPWYDLLFIVAADIGTLYVFLNYQSIYVLERTLATPTEQVLGVVTICVVAEAVRRTIGWPMMIISAIFLLHAMFASYLPGLLGGPPLSLSRLIAYIYLYPQGIFGTVAELAGTIVMIFIVFGSFLQVSGAGKWFVDLAMSVVGNMAGGPAKVAVVSSALFGTISGSPMANAATTGSITIPMMKGIGYKPHFAGAVEGVASTGGIVMPPVMGAAAFLMAYYTGAGYPAVCVAAVLPAIFYFLALYLQVDFEARKLGLLGLPREMLPSLRKTLIGGWPFAIPLLLLVVLMMGFGYNAPKACIYSLAALILVSLSKKETRMGLGKILTALEEGSRGMLPVASIMSLIGVVTGSIAITGLGVKLSLFLVDLSGGHLILLASMAAVAMYIMGMGVSAMLDYILFAILVAPALMQLGMPKMAAHMFVLYMSCSTYITPPNAGTIFVTAAIAGSGVFRTGYKAMQLGIVTYLVPFVLVFRPALVLQGTLTEIAVAASTTLLAVVSLALCFEGFLFKPIRLWQRIGLVLGGWAIVVPYWRLNVVGAIFLFLVLFWQWRARTGY